MYLSPFLITEISNIVNLYLTNHICVICKRNNWLLDENNKCNKCNRRGKLGTHLFNVVRKTCCYSCQSHKRGVGFYYKPLFTLYKYSEFINLYMKDNDLVNFPKIKKTDYRSHMICKKQCYCHAVPHLYSYI